MKLETAAVLIGLAVSVVIHTAVLAVSPWVRLGGAAAAPEVKRDFKVSAVVEKPAEKKEFDVGSPQGTGFASHERVAKREAAFREAPTDQPLLAIKPPKVESKPVQPKPKPAPVVKPKGAIKAAPTPPQPPPPKPAPERVQSDETRNAAISDSEVDPFSTLGATVDRDGNVTVRSGRKVKTRKPKLTLAAKMELLTMQEPKVVLEVSIDETGKVTAVRVHESSGSAALDQPCRVSMYEWWFEPKKDKAGKPVPDRFIFTIGWR